MTTQATKQLTSQVIAAIAQICGYQQTCDERPLAHWMEILDLASYAGYDVTKNANKCGIEILSLDCKRQTLSLIDANSALLGTHNHHLADFEKQLAAAIAL